MKRRTRRKILYYCFLYPIAVLLLPFWVVFAKVARRFPTKAMRHQGNALQTPVVFYRHPETSREVVIVTTLHIGEIGYFPSLQEVIDSRQNHVVLYEAIRRLRPEQAQTITSDEFAVAKTIDFDFTLRMAMMSSLGLVSQYHAGGLICRESWINTDMTMPELLKSFVQREIKPSKGGDLEWASSPLATWLFDAILHNYVPFTLTIKFVGLALPQWHRRKKIILGRRNEIAAAAIQQYVQEGRDVIAIWGADHLKGIERYILAAGFVAKRREWFDAYHSRNHSFLEAIRGKLET